MTPDLIGADSRDHKLDLSLIPRSSPHRFIRAPGLVTQTDWIKENCPEMWILLVSREPHKFQMVA